MNIEKSPLEWPSAGTQFEQTRDGQPLSINRQPRESLRAWVSNVYGIHVTSMSGKLRECGIFAEGAVLRVLLEGDWQAETRDGVQSYQRGALLFGPNARRMPINVSGNIATVGLALKPGAVHALRGPDLPWLNNRVLPYAMLGWDEVALMARFSPDDTVEQWMDALEDCMELLVRQIDPRAPSEVSAGFSRIAFDDPNIAVFACYAEGFQPLDGMRFVAAARKITASGRAVILYRAGRTSAGRQASATHTATIAGETGLRFVTGSDGSTLRGFVINRFDGNGIDPLLDERSHRFPLRTQIESLR